MSSRYRLCQIMGKGHLLALTVEQSG
uniref:Uncharacterized protein n=1 Tax=Arundo donax TaxID=35708 RepID=A0A0A9APT4_ARUDO